MKEKKQWLTAEGIMHAVKDVGVSVPLVVRLEGNNSELGAKMLAENVMNIVEAKDFAAAA